MKEFIKKFPPHLLIPSACAALLVIIFSIFFFVQSAQINKKVLTLGIEKDAAQSNLQKTQQAFTALKNQDQYKINQQLKEEITNINALYKQSILAYQTIQDLQAQKQDTSRLDVVYAEIVKNLSDRNYASASGLLKNLTTDIQQMSDKLAASTGTSTSPTSSNAPVNNTPPSSGYSRQSVNSDIGTFAVDIISADLNSTKVVVDTASDSDCHDNCPVMPLGDYVARSGAFAGINGTYFCPSTYPQCAGKTNSFDLLVMNKNKHYLNSDNNVYSTNPAVIFSGNSARYVGQASQWGRDTGVDAVLSNYPLLLSGGQVVFNGDGDPKKGSKGSRSFIGTKGSTVYIGVIHDVTVAEGAHVLKALGLENALNLDSGGSVALWFGGYKLGPGRNLPNAVLFVKK